MNFKSYLPFYKRNLVVAIPVILSQIGLVVVQMADTMMVGRLGAIELASVSFASALINLGLFFATSSALGLTPLVGRNFSQGNTKKVTQLFQNAFTFNTLMGILIMILLLLAGQFLDYMGQTEEVVHLAKPYMQIIAISLVPVLVFLAFKQFLEGIGNTRIAMVITILSNIINVGLNYMLIYGKWGAPALGVNGAAYATLISRLFLPIAFLGVFFYQKNLRTYLQQFKREHFAVGTVKEISQVGLPIGFQVLAEQGAFSFTTIMVGWLGAVSLAGHQVAMNVSYLVFMILQGLGAATTIRVSHQLGMKAIGDMRKAAHASYHITTLTIILSTILIITFRHDIPRFFTQDPAVIAQSANLLIIAAIYLIPDGYQVVSLGALRGIADVKKPMIYSSMAYLGLNIPVGYICGFVLNLGTMGIWVGFVVGLTTVAICFMRRFEQRTRAMLPAA